MKNRAVRDSASFALLFIIFTQGCPNQITAVLTRAKNYQDFSAVMRFTGAIWVFLYKKSMVLKFQSYFCNYGNNINYKKWM